MHLNFKARHTRSAHERPCVKTREVADSSCALSFLVYFGFPCGPTFHESHIFFFPSFPLHHTNQSKVLRAQADARVLDQINPLSQLAAPLPDGRSDCRDAASHEARAVCKFSAYNLMTEQVLQVRPSG